MILLLLTLPPLASSSPPPPSHCPGTLVSSGVQDSPVDVTAPTASGADIRGITSDMFGDVKVQLGRLRPR